jgi:hypothetical protein
MATEYETYLRRYLNDNGTIWTSAQLEAWALEAEQDIVKQVPCIVDRIALDIRSGNPLYEIPDDCVGIRRISWLGYKIYPLTKLETQALYPNEVIADNFFGAFSSAFSDAFFVASSNSSTTTGRPYHWSYSGYAWNKIQLFPAPGVTIATTTTGLWDSAISTNCIVEYYRLPNVSTQVHRVPSYVRRYLIKDAVLAKAFSIEGIGQDLQAAQWHGKRFEVNLEIFKAINSGVFVAKRQRLGIQNSLFENMRGKAVLPPQFGPQSWR